MGLQGSSKHYLEGVLYVLHKTEWASQAPQEQEGQCSEMCCPVLKSGGEQIVAAACSCQYGIDNCV
jgi:hypothetical protein